MHGSAMGFGAQVQTAKDLPLSELLDSIQPQDLVKFGLIPEFVGRVPILTHVDDLDEKSLVRILVEPKNALTKQYPALLQTENVRLSFTDDGLEEIASFAEEINSHNEDIGARRLYTIMEKVLADVSFDAPDMPGAQIMINRDYVRDHLTDVREDQDLSRYIL